MDEVQTIEDFYPLTFPIKKNTIPDNIYKKILDETLYNLYIVNLYKFTSDVYPRCYYLNDVVKCTETELSIFKKLGYYYYKDGSIGGEQDSSDIYLYRVGYYTHTIPDYFGLTKKWMPVLSNEIRNVRIELNWEFKYKYQDIITRIKNNRKWDFLITFMCIQIPANIQYCNMTISTNVTIPIELGGIIYEYWRE